MRDEFSEDVKRAIAQRVNYLCSQPKCHAQTTGPQDHPAKVVNVGVAAHITAASSGGPRYDPELTSEQRKSPENAIWLCQNCAKLVDSDAVQFPVALLQKWKDDAEAYARSRVGKTGASITVPSFPQLKAGRRVTIQPTIPREFQIEQFLIEAVETDFFQVQKPSSMHHIKIPINAVQKIQSWGPFEPPWIMLDGRLQWRTKSRTWVYLPQQPPFGPIGEYGAWRDVWMFDPSLSEAWKGLEARWVSRRELLRHRTLGWTIFYGEDGLYLRNEDRSGDLILMCKLA